MTLRSTSACCLLSASFSISAQAQAAPGETVRLWQATAPGERADMPEQQTEVGTKDGIERTKNVSVPTMQWFSPTDGEGNGSAILVCPGGGYNLLASEHEGTAVCEWLNRFGYTAILLRYRVPRRDLQAKHQAPLQDAQRAISMIRGRAAESKIDPARIGILGFSAGGHLAAMALSNPERNFATDPEIDAASCRPDFGILIYPAYLVDESDDDKIAAELDVEKINQPVFIAVASDDRWAHDSAVLNRELLERKMPVTLHTFTEGGHGFGLKKDLKPPVSEWTKRCIDWLQSVGLDKAN